MKDSNIDVDIIDETLLYICIDGKREHISVDNARIKYVKNKQVLTMIDEVLAKYKANSEPLPNVEEQNVPITEVSKQEATLKDLNDAPLEDIEIDLEDASLQKEIEPTLADLNSKPLEPAVRSAIPKEPMGSKNGQALDELNDAPLVDESKFASIYDKYNSRIRETFPTDSPSFLDVEKLARNSKPLEQTR